MPFQDPIAAGFKLVRFAFESPDFQTGVQGWALFKDGSAELASAVIRGMVVAGDVNGSHIVIDPNVSVGFNDGFLESVIRMFPDDPMMMMEGMLGVVTFEQGAVNAEMATILHSPIGTTGFAMVLAADADDLSRNAHASIGPVTVDGDAMSYVPIIMIEEYGLTTPAYLSYASQPGEIVETFQTVGAINWVAPAGVTSVKVECWGGGGSGANPGTAAGGGGAGGEYAAEAVVAVTPGNTYVANVGGLSGTSSFAGNALTVTAHGGGTNAGSGGAIGGTGSTNSVHHNGGNGAATAFSGGGGGGGAAGTTAVGGLGSPGQSSGQGGAGGLGGATGGGTGGVGGVKDGASGQQGFAPGGGGGGAGSGTAGVAGHGANGQVRLTYTPTGSQIAASMAAVAGTDRFGNSYPAGLAVGTQLIPQGNVALGHSNTANTPTATEIKDVIGDVTFTAVAGRTYRFKYSARADSVGGTADIDFRIRGNNSAVSPTTASTILAAASETTVGAGGAGSGQLIAEQTRVCAASPAADQIAPGLWTVAAFFARVAGAATTVVADNATSQFRELSIDDVG